MRLRAKHILFMLVLVYVLPSCNLLKFVPEDRTLLHRVVIEDTLGKPVGGLDGYLRQKPNSKVLGFWPLQLQIYNTAPKDTTTKAKKRLQRNAFRMGEAPEIYDESLAAASMREFQKALVNNGYFHAEVDTMTVVKKRKTDLHYIVRKGDRYHLRSYKVDLPVSTVREIATDGEGLLAAGDGFSAGMMDSERDRIAMAMRNDGYFYYEKSMLDYEADSSWRANEVSLRLKESEQLTLLYDSLYEQAYRRMYISSVRFEQGDRRFLREDVLRRRCCIRPGQPYRERDVERSYAQLNSLGAVKYVDIAFRPVSKDSLECVVTLSKNKLNNVSAEFEGTYSAGDWGLAAGAGYTNRNIFRGSEQLSVDVRFSHEWRRNAGRAIEAKVTAGLDWPNNLNLNIGYSYQTRPDEFTRTIALAGLNYNIRRYDSRWRHTFGLVDISYIHLPWISDEYRQRILDKSSILRYSYEDHLIVDWNYTGMYSSKNTAHPERSYLDFRYSIETAGNFLYACSKMAKAQTDSTGQYRILGIAYSQYVKGDVNFTYNQALNEKHRLVYHVGIGVVMPYLNSKMVPFEKRYFSGGSNSVRGWQSRTLGPGAYHGGDDGRLRYDLQAGDIRLDLNLEYRWKVWSIIELAAFTDAGNIWTIRDYDSQPGGVFRFDSFYRQIAWSYGAGLRLDFSVLVFRVDLGVKLYDPSRLNTDRRMWRTVPNGLRWKDDMTLHFAIGYPF